MTVNPSSRAKVITEARRSPLAQISLPWLPVLRTSLEISGTAQLLATVSAGTTAARVTQPWPQMYFDRFGFRLWSKWKPASGAFFEAPGPSVSSVSKYQTGGAQL